MAKNEMIRNVAIVAHVDHGKTTLVDCMFRCCGIFRENEATVERAMDSNDLEKERGITILAKNTAINYKGYKINVIDTPGHADFGGEVERSLKMADGVLLLVDAFEGCMPQTRFVLKKALALGLKPIVVVNKIDRPNQRAQQVADDALMLMLELDADDEQLDSPIIYASARNAYATASPEVLTDNLDILFETIISHIPCPQGDSDGSFQMLTSNIDYDEYTGRIAVGRIERGELRVNDQCCVVKEGSDSRRNGKITKMFVYDGLKKVPAVTAKAGDIVALSGFSDINIGETICAADAPQPLPFVEINQPVLSMMFSVNNSPFAGREGQYVTSRHLRDRLNKELQFNISLKVEETDSPDSFNVAGRGELHLSVLIENMRREGYEFIVSKPTVINQIQDGQVHEPIELLMIDVPDEYRGAVIELCGMRCAQLTDMKVSPTGYTKLEFTIPSRGLIGCRGALLTATRGTAIINHVFTHYEPLRGDITTRLRGSLTSFETGEATSYGLYGAQERGTLFIPPATAVYEGMIVGESSRPEDIAVNVCRKKHVTNMRASGSDDALRLSPHRILSLEQCLEFIAEDELLEITPKNLRLRKKILSASLRAKANK